jgi:GTP-binding protein
VAVVGRPNVGKSTLTNALAGTRISIVEPTPGVTRDRVGVLCTLADRTVEVVDTGGLGIEDPQGLSRQVEEQVRRAIREAEVILFVVDAREGVTPLDRRVADRLRPEAARVVLLANKVESAKIGWGVAEFAELGFGEPLPISAQEKIGLSEVESALARLLPDAAGAPARPPPPDLKIAVVGRVNAGKSTFVNALLADDRMIVSEVPGTTRDSVDLRLERDGRTIVVIDTAGIRKERSIQGGAEFYAQRRAEKAMRRADVTVLVLDAAADVGRLDRRIAGYATEGFHPLVLVANKWDLRPSGVTKSSFVKYLRSSLGGFEFAPVAFTSAREGTGVEAVLAVCARLAEQAATRVSTSAVNRVLVEAQKIRAPKPRRGGVGTIYYGTQVDTRPPSFVIFVNDPALFDDGYLRYLQNRFRAALAIAEVPIRFRLKPRPRTAPGAAARSPRPVEAE